MRNVPLDDEYYGFLMVHGMHYVGPTSPQFLCLLSHFLTVPLSRGVELLVGTHQVYQSKCFTDLLLKIGVNIWEMQLLQLMSITLKLSPFLSGEASRRKGSQKIITSEEVDCEKTKRS